MFSKKGKQNETVKCTELDKKKVIYVSLVQLRLFGIFFVLFSARKYTFLKEKRHDSLIRKFILL